MATSDTIAAAFSPKGRPLLLSCCSCCCEEDEEEDRRAQMDKIFRLCCCISAFSLSGSAFQPRRTRCSMLHIRTHNPHV